MTSGRHFPDDRGMWGSDQMFRPEYLFPGRDVVRLASEQVERDFDVLQRQFSPQTDELTLGETIRLEQFLDGLQIVAAGQIDRVLIPSLEALATSDVALVRDVLIKVDVFPEVLLA